WNDEIARGFGAHAWWELRGMMRNFVDEKITESAAMYALGILSQTESRAFERCLNTDVEDYSDELAAFAAVVAALAFNAPERTPPELTRKRLLFAVANEAESVASPAIARP